MFGVSHWGHIYIYIYIYHHLLFYITHGDGIRVMTHLGDDTAMTWYRDDQSAAGGEPVTVLHRYPDFFPGILFLA